MLSLSSARAFTILRISISLIMTAHAVERLWLGTVPGFGSFLEAKGFPAGELVAWGLTFMEISCSILLAVGLIKKLACLFFVIELLMGIVLVHAANGWFVVGATAGGMEYNVLLIICFSLTGLTAREEISIEE